MRTLEDQCNGETIDGIEAVDMIRHFEDTVICAKRGGSDFLTTPRINP